MLSITLEYWFVVPNPTLFKYHSAFPVALGQVNTLSRTKCSPGTLLAVCCLFFMSYNQTLFLYFSSSRLFPSLSTLLPSCSLWPWPSRSSWVYFFFFFFPLSCIQNSHVERQCAAQTHKQFPLFVLLFSFPSPAHTLANNITKTVIRVLLNMYSLDLVLPLLLFPTFLSPSHTYCTVHVSFANVATPLGFKIKSGSSVCI